MVPFDDSSLNYAGPDDKLLERPDWAMLRYGPVAMFRRMAVLTETIEWLEQHGYTVAQADCERCSSEEEVLWAIGKAFGLPHVSYPNLDGFNDFCRHIDVPLAGGFAIALHRFDLVAAKFPEFARSVLDILAWASWDNLLFGRRLICMVRSEDPWIQIGLVGGREPWWNRQEWFQADRA